MTIRRVPPKAVIVFDVNVLIDAVNPYSANHDKATRALSDDNGMPIFFSDTMLKTTANKLLEMGADPGVVREYIELIMSEDDYGPEKQVIEHVRVTDYKLTDKFGNDDFEDSTIISLMDAAEDSSKLPAILVSNDSALREWCTDNQRMAVRPERLSSQTPDDVRQGTYQYMSRRMFRIEAQQPPNASTKVHAKQIVNGFRRELNQNMIPGTPLAEERYKRFPELRPTEVSEIKIVERDGYQR